MIPFKNGERVCVKSFSEILTECENNPDMDRYRCGFDRYYGIDVETIEALAKRYPYCTVTDTGSRSCHLEEDEDIYWWSYYMLRPYEEHEESCDDLVPPDPDALFSDLFGDPV